jgi:hypothetical protein
MRNCKITLDHSEIILKKEGKNLCAFVQVEDKIQNHIRKSLVKNKLHNEIQGFNMR